MQNAECRMQNEEGISGFLHSSFCVLHSMSLGLYVHFPFCRVHCSYCAFAVSTDLTLQERYVDALLREIDGRGGERGDSIYFGGGTPSRTDRPHLAAVSARIRERFEVAENAEFSLEANPEDVSSEAIDFWRSMGANRLSIGGASVPHWG